MFLYLLANMIHLIDICVYIFLLFFTDQNNCAALIVIFAYKYDQNKIQVSCGRCWIIWSWQKAVMWDR